MKRLILILSIAFVVSEAMSQYIVIHKNDGGKNVELAISYIDSITIVDVEMVDLGLPSGLKWASCNVGALSPEGIGYKFLWGATSPTATDFPYTEKSSLPLENDAAYVNWGSDWRMPTRTEFQELLDECTWVYDTFNEINGYTVTGPNGNCIFLPTTSLRYFSRTYSRYTTPSSFAPNIHFYCLNISSSEYYISEGYTYIYSTSNGSGYIRAVSEK